MTVLASVALLASALVHLLPTMGVLGASRLKSLYGISPDDPTMRLLLQHRAVLFGIVAGVCLAGALWSPLRLTALVVAAISTWSFVAIWGAVGVRSTPIDRVAYIDIALGVLLVTALVGVLATQY